MTEIAFRADDGHIRAHLDAPGPISWGAGMIGRASPSVADATLIRCFLSRLLNLSRADRNSARCRTRTRCWRTVHLDLHSFPTANPSKRSAPMKLQLVILARESSDPGWLS
jgi:hypothetical protein